MLRRTNRLRDAALVIPIGGVVLFLPPYVLIFDQSGYFFGIPFLHVALFTCWLVGIILTALMARVLLRTSTTAPDTNQTEHDAHIKPAEPASQGLTKAPRGGSRNA